MSPLLASFGSARGFGLLRAGGGGGAGFESIATVTAAGGETSLSFSSIPQGYQSLQIRGIARDTTVATSAVSLYIQFNSDTGTNYARHTFIGDGATASSYGGITATSLFIGSTLVPRDSNTAGLFGAFIVDVHDYASTTRNKTFRSFSGVDMNGTGVLHHHSGLWINTNAITSLQITESGTSFKAGTTIALYGIKGA